MLALSYLYFSHNLYTSNYNEIKYNAVSYENIYICFIIWKTYILFPELLNQDHAKKCVRSICLRGVMRGFVTPTWPLPWERPRRHIHIRSVKGHLLLSVFSRWCICLEICKYDSRREITHVVITNDDSYIRIGLNRRRHISSQLSNGRRERS